jgi:hypothetical protein
MGEQQGRLIGPLVRRVVQAVVHGEANTEETLARLLQGSMVMERYLPDNIRRELQALARTAGVPYPELVALQLFGDVWRAGGCSSYAVYGPATATGECLIGRNFDYWDHGVGDYASVILHYLPSEGHPFMTITWAGVINGWTAMNSRGLVAANNTSYGRVDSLHGLSTCFMIREIVQRAATVQEGVDLITATPRACGTNMLVAGGNPPAAAVVEYDHEGLAVRWAQEGRLVATNHFRTLYQDPPMAADEGWCSRYRTLWGLISEKYGRLTRSDNLAGAPGVPMTSINLHSALLFPADLSFKVSMGRTPACHFPYLSFRLTPEAIVPGAP